MASPPDPALPGISCVIPVYNEASMVGDTLRAVAEVLGRCGRPWELIVIDDGSTDGSGAAIEASGVDCRTIRTRRNRGYGAAIKEGCRRAQHPWILIIDADGTYPPGEIARLTAALEDDQPADMIVGRRRQTAATDGPLRRMGKAILVMLATFLAGMDIPDLNSGLRLMRRELVERYWPLLPDGFSLTTSITLASLCSGAAVRWVPIEYRARAGEPSKIRPARDMWNFIVLILRTMTYFNPLKVYAPAAGVLVAGAVGTVLISKFVGGQVMDVTALFLFMAGLQMLLIGVIADLILKVTGTREK